MTSFFTGSLPDRHRLEREKLEAEAPDNISWDSAMRIGNTVGTAVLNPELYGAARDRNFNLGEYKEYLTSLTPAEQGVAVTAISEQDMYNKVERFRADQEAFSEAQQVGLLNSLPKILAAGLTDPLNAIPLGGLAYKMFKLGKHGDRINNIARNTLAFGGVGATFGVLSEAVRDDMELETDYGSSILFGFILGGGLGSLGGALQRTAKPSDALLAMTAKDDIIDERNFRIAKVDPDAPMVSATGVPAQLKKAGPEIFSIETPGQIKKTGGWASFMRSDVLEAYGSASGALRKAVSYFVNPHVGVGMVVNRNDGYTNIKRLDGRTMNTADIELGTAYREAKLSGEFTGSRQEYIDTIGKSYATKAMKQEEAVHSDAQFIQGREEFRKLEAELKAKRKETKDAKEIKAIEEQLALAKRQLRESEGDIWKKYMPESMTKGERVVSDYYRKMLEEGKRVGVLEFEGISSSRMYIPRQANIENLRKIPAEKQKQLIEQAIVTHPSNRWMNEKDVKAAAEAYWLSSFSKAYNTAFDINSRSMALGKEMGNDRSLRGRKFYLNTNEMIDLLDTSAMEAMGKYHYWMRGQIAIREAVPELRNTASDQLFSKYEELIKTPLVKEMQNLSPAEAAVRQTEINALDNIVNDLIGTLRIAQNNKTAGWVTSRVLTQASALTMSGMMGLIQMFEIPAALWATNYNRILHKQYGSFMADTIKAMSTKEYTSFQKELVQMGYLSTAMMQAGINRLTDTSSTFNVGKLENALMGLNHKTYALVGMRPMTAWLETVVASNVINKLRDFNPAKVSKKDRNLYNQWSLKDEDILSIQRQLKEHGDIRPDGTIVTLGLDKLDDTAKEALSVAVSRGIETGVLQGTTFNVPTWMKVPTPFKRLMTQFWRFPLTANEKYLQRGLAEDKAGLLAAGLGGMLMSGSLYYLIEQAEIGMGIRSPLDARFDLNTEEGRKALTLQALTYSGVFSGLMLPLELMQGVFTAAGKDTPFSQYQGRETASFLLGAGGSHVENIRTILDQGVKGQFDSEAAWLAFKRLTVPAGNAPFLGREVDNIIKENTIKYRD